MADDDQPYLEGFASEPRRKVVETREPVRWTADEFVLTPSFVGQGRQQVLARWPLR